MNSMKKSIVLVVEDSPTQAAQLEYLLGTHGFSVFIAEDGKMGIAAVKKRRPDIILSDVNMPVMNGFELCRVIKGDDDLKDIPVILLTAMSDPEDIIRGLEAGADYYLTKPYSDEEILSKITSIQETKALQKNKGNMKKNREIEVSFQNKMFIIKSNRRQILNLLLSTYENAVHKNLKLLEVQKELQILNEKLEGNLYELETAERKFRYFVQTIPDIVYRVDTEGRFVFINETVRILDYDPGELVGRHFSEIVFSTEEADRISRKRVLKEYTGMVTGDKNAPKLFDERRTGERKTTGLEVRLASKGGKKTAPGLVEPIDREAVDVEVNSSGMYQRDLLTGSDVFIGSVGVIRNITERKKMEEAKEESEKRLRSFMDSAVDSFILLDSELNLVDLNKAAEVLMQNAGAESEIMKKNIFKVLPAIGESFGNEECIKVIETGRPLFIDDVILPAKTGNMHLSVKVFKMSSGLGVSATDITERVKMDEELLMAKETAEFASRSKSDFLASMSHELRTPLNAIIGFSDILHQKYFGELNEKQWQYVSYILESGNHLLNLINDILDLSKIESGKIELELSEVDVPELVEDSQVMVREKCLKHGIQIETFLPESEAVIIRADERKLKQVMFNLLSNAAKFTPDGGRITVTVRKEGEELLISVADTGIGIAPDQQDRIFGEFYQVKGGPSAKTPGTGLGLSLVKRLVEKHGGRVWVESEGVGRGSKFSFTIPLRRR